MSLPNIGDVLAHDFEFAGVRGAEVSWGMRFPWEPAKDDLETRVKRLETEVVELRLQWSEVLDKLLHRLQRQAKRDRDATAKALDAPTSPVDQLTLPATEVQGRADRLRAARARLSAMGRGNGRVADETRHNRADAG